VTRPAPPSTAPLLRPDAPARVGDLLSEAGLDGWLLYDFGGQNPLAHALLGLGKTTRRAFVLFRRTGEPVLLRHAIEASAWSGWRWEARSYSGWKELERALPDLLGGARRVAMEVSPGNAVPTVDRVSAGVLELVRGTGVEVASSGDLVSHFHSVWGDAGLASHRRAAAIVREVAHGAFERAGAAIRSGAPLREADLMAWIVSELQGRGLADQTGCIAAVARNAADPHYHPSDGGDLVEPGQALLVDLWGAEAGGIPADQTWMAFLGDRPDPRTVEIWSAVRDARDRALELLAEAHASGRELRGFEVDRAARDLLEAKGFGRWFVHRLGHSIDRDLHGSGPNLDDLETRDDRRILPGTGFSVEPGVYIPGEIGVRSEVNVYWGDDGPEVTPSSIQRELVQVDVTPDGR
jgi:Xaa-Pro dipeptidase